mmetsp:Transcript_14138/g.20828  ORF Transcript_14138/g.20828 Transcript_14138/m.20828 type:complete len:151 (-) Transcript_14138:98-550(-)
MASLFLKQLNTKREVDNAIRNTVDKVVILRFGSVHDLDCLKMDEILASVEVSLENMAQIFTVDPNDVPIYSEYFDITIVPATIFFFNSRHIKVDYGTADHTKFIGPFFCKQDCIDLVEVIYRGAKREKVMITSPIDRRHIPRYDLVYKDI